MVPSMRRFLAPSFVALLALCALASPALARTPRPVITSISPSQVGIGGTLVLKGKNFSSGATNNRVFFSRATDGKTVRARPRKASKTRIEVIVPSTLTKFLINGDKTRFQVAIFTKVLGPKTKTSRSPLIFPAGSTPTPGTPGNPSTPGTPAPPPDCDGDGTPDSVDNDDDNDGLSDDLENAIHTAVCNKDTDGDGVEDGYEYWSARDLNSSAVPYPGKRPYPNPLDASDAGKDFDADGMTESEEFQAWNLYGGRVLPSGDGQTFPYSDGNQSSPAPNNAGGTDYDGNGLVTDEEKDADNDGLANWIELAKGSTLETTKMNFGFFHQPNGTACPVVNGPRFQDCGAGTIGNGNTYTDGAFASYYVPNWLDPDSDGDGINDGADDLDHDGISDLAEIAAATSPVNPCDPNTESRTCSQH